MEYVVCKFSLFPHYNRMCLRQESHWGSNNEDFWKERNVVLWLRFILSNIRHTSKQTLVTLWIILFYASSSLFLQSHNSGVQLWQLFREQCRLVLSIFLAYLSHVLLWHFLKTINFTVYLSVKCLHLLVLRCTSINKEKS